MFDYEKHLAFEKKCYAKIEQMALENSEYLNAIWHQGDGDGGGVLDIIRDALGHDNPRCNKPSTIKKKISNSKRKRVFENDKYRCKKCKTHKNLSIDHIIPESKGGSNKDENLQTLCKPCNSSKGVRDNQEFMDL